MSFVIQGEITIDADGAVRGVKVSRDQLKGLGADAERVEDQLKGVGAQAGGVGRRSKMAAGHVANLQAQFNDIGVMMASGQSPLQLAMRQGTQVNQVLAQMGGGIGAVKALGGAFRSMINPLSLATLGIIAGGTALAQWVIKALGAEQQADSLADTISDLSALEKVFEDIGQSMDTELGDRIEAIREKYGSLVADIAQSRVDALNNSIADALAPIQGQLQASRDFDPLRGGRAEAEEQARAVTEILNSIGGATRDEIATSFAAAYEQLEAMLGPGHEFLTIMRQIASEANLLEAASAARGSAADAVTAAITRQYQAYQNSRIASQQAHATAQEMLVTLQRENAIQAAIVRHGEDSAEVAALRAAAEREAFEEVLATLDVSEDVKDELRAAKEEAIALANTDMAGPISAAATEAGRLAENLAIARGQAAQDAIEAMGGDSGFFDPRGTLYGSSGSGVLNPDRPVPVQNRPNYVAPRLSTSGSSRASGRSSAAREADREREAVTNLLESLQQELDVTREMDPVLKEMIGYRDQLQAATAEERLEIEALIRARIEEEAALERQQELWGLWNDAAMTAITDVNGALNMLLGSLQKAALTGGGPLGFLFGGQDDTGKGGLLGSIFGALFPGKADGGIILGAGGPRDDRQIIRTSPGEYIVNARATARNRALLDAINYGTPGMADGGPVGGGRAAAVAGGGTRSLLPEVHVHVTSGGGDDVYEQARQGAQAALEEYDRHVLPLRMREISNSPEVIG